MDRSKQTVARGAPPKRQLALNESLKELLAANSQSQIETSASGSSEAGHYKVVQIFDGKWQRKFLGPPNHVAWQGCGELETIKKWAQENLMEYPTIAIHICNVDDPTEPTLCYNGDDGWIERPVRRGWF